MGSPVASEIEALDHTNIIGAARYYPHGGRATVHGGGSQQHEDDPVSS
jgi:hypothetical protein